MSDKMISIPIARTGSFTDSQGRPQTFSESDLDAIASSYNPQKLEAPLVFGHPEVSDPAYGWVKSLKREGSKLFAQIAQVPDAVRSLVQDGRYRYVSMSLMPDRKTLRHVGLLGAAVPAIDGLGPVSLSNGNDAVTINFSTGDGNMPTPNTPSVDELTARVSALEAEKAALQTKLTQAESALTQAKADFTSYRNGIEVKAREARMDELVKSGRVKPAERAMYMSFAAMLAKQTETFDFASPDGTVQKLSAEERYFRELESRQPNPVTLDFSAGNPPQHQQQPTATFSPNAITSKL